MKVAVSAQGPDLDSPVDSRFGRAPYFVIVDLETGNHETLANPNVGAAQGAGIQTARLLGNRGVGAVLTGNIGPNPVSALRATGTEIHLGISGTVSQAVEAFRRGELEPCSGPTVEAHFGLGRGGGRGQGPREAGRGGRRGRRT